MDPPIIENIGHVQQGQPQRQDDQASWVSSVMPSRAPERLGSLHKAPTRQAWDPDSPLYHFFKTLGMPDDFLLNLERGGFTQPHRVVNNFGMDTNHIAASFSIIGSMQVFQPEYLQPCMSLVMFSRWCLLGTIEKEPSVTKPWKMMKQGRRFNKAFNNFSKDKLQTIIAFINDPVNAYIAKRTIHQIRQLLRTWIKNDKFPDDITLPSLPSSGKSTPSPPSTRFPLMVPPAFTPPTQTRAQTTSTTGNTQSYQRSPDPPHTPQTMTQHPKQKVSKTSIKTVEDIAKDMENKLNMQLETIKKLFGPTLTDLNTTVKSLQQERTNAQATMSSHDKEIKEVRKHLEVLFTNKKEESPHGAQTTDGDDTLHHTNTVDIDLEEEITFVPEEKIAHSFAQLPRTSFKSSENRPNLSKRTP